MRFRLGLFAGLALTAWAQAPATAPPKPPAQPAAQPAAAAPRPATRTAGARGAASPSPKDLKFGAPRPLDPPKPQRVELPNGLRVLLVEDHDTPLVTASALVRTGTTFEAPNRAGLASLTATLVRTGGTAQRRPENLDADLEQLGASIDSSVAEMQTSITLTVLRENFAEALTIYRDVLMEPAFRQDKLDAAKATLGQSSLRRNDDVREIMRRELWGILFGRDRAGGRAPDYSTLSPISRADVNAFWKRYFYPGNVVLTIAGDFDSAQLKGTLETLFGAWNGPRQPIDLPNVEAKPAPGGYVAVKPDLRETYFSVAQVAVAFNDPDAAALDVAAAILGFGAQSRLVTRARETRGALREVRAEVLPGIGKLGVFLVSGAGATAATGDSVRMILDEIQKLRAAEPTEEEVRVARELVLMTFLGGLDNKTRALTALATLERHGYTEDALTRYQSSVTAVTRADVLRVAKSRLDPEKMSVLAVSNLSAFSKPLDPRGGASKPVDLTIPPPASGGGATITATAAEIGKKLLARAQQAAGGADRLAAVKDYSQTATYANQDGSFDTQTDRWLAPATLRQDAQSNRLGTIVRYTDGQTGWLSNGRNSTSLNGATLRQAREELVRAYVPMLLSDRLPGRTVVALDDETVEIAMDGLTTRVVFDSQTGLPAKLLYETTWERQPTIFAEEEFSDFREVAGIKVPFSIAVRRNGAKYATGTVSEFKINIGLKPEVLQRRP